MSARPLFATSSQAPLQDERAADDSFSYRQLVEQAQTGMFIVQDELLTYANPKFLEMVGYSKERLVGVRTASSVVHETDRAHFEEQVRQRFAGVAGTPYEVQIERADGSTFVARVYGRLVTRNERPADLITVDDVTELTQAAEKIKRTYLTSIKVFSNILGLRGGQLAGHGRRVADLARGLAEAAGLGADETQDVFVAGLLHDMGMIGMSDASLDKPLPKMDPAELAAYRQHAAFGEQSLMALEDMHPVARLIRSHHERFDGNGFPDKLAGNDIPPGARILAIADTFDDLVHGLMGGNKLKPSEAKMLMQRGRGTQFDPELLDAFIQLHPDAPPKTPEKPPLTLGTDGLRPGMVLAADLVSPSGVMMLPSDHVLTVDMIERIRNFEKREGQGIALLVKQR